MVFVAKQFSTVIFAVSNSLHSTILWQDFVCFFVSHPSVLYQIITILARVQSCVNNRTLCNAIRTNVNKNCLEMLCA